MVWYMWSQECLRRGLVPALNSAKLKVHASSVTGDEHGEGNVWTVP